MRKTTTITLYPQVSSLVTKIRYISPGKVSLLFNYALYKLFEENSDVLKLIDEAEKLLKRR